MDPKQPHEAARSVTYRWPQWWTITALPAGDSAPHFGSLFGLLYQLADIPRDHLRIIAARMHDAPNLAWSGIVAGYRCEACPPAIMAHHEGWADTASHLDLLAAMVGMEREDLRELAAALYPLIKSLEEES